MLFSSKGSPSDVPAVVLGQSILSQALTHKYLGVCLNTKLSWDNHKLNLITKANKQNVIMKSYKYNSLGSFMK